MRYILILILICSSTLPIFSQAIVDINNLQNLYESFNYQKVISQSEELLLDKERFTKENLIIIYTLKASSQYSISDFENSRKSFIEILKIDENFDLDSSQFSPKLVDFFNDVKKEFLEILDVKEESDLHKSNLDKNPVLDSNNYNEKNIAIAKSIILPGLGHLHLNDNPKGWILTSASTITLGSMIYFIFDAQNKEKEYLAQTKPDLIKMKYDSYNGSYKIRNFLIGTYIAIWLYSQIDMLFFSDQLESNKVLSNFENFNFQNHRNGLQFSINITF